MFRIATQHETYAALAGPSRGVGDAFGQESVVPQVGVRIERHGREEDDYGLLKKIGGFDGDIERGIVQSTLRSLHPVHDTTATQLRRSRTADRYAWIRSEVLQCLHGGADLS